ncbi:MAG: N-acetylglucosamine-6-phosphate deacetylase [Oscillospiraceae bacterium]|nr:N-acetylglucosamine-6-phosphate deacetylase [Oscillospiraceae bacterium]
MGLLIKNARAVLPDRVTSPLQVLIEDGKIAAIDETISASAPTLDLAGDYLFPGFVDVHIHGGGGADFMDATVDAFETAVKAHLQRGTTTLVPTAMTATRQELLAFLDAFLAFRATSPYGSHTPGVHLEGPYFSGADSKSKGAQKGDVLRSIDLEEVEQLIKAAKGSILRWDAAPELAHSAEFATRLKKEGILCAAAHTDATGFEAQAGFEAGFSHVTHFYNACTAYKKREQLVTAGIVEAAYLDDAVTVELICDGKHIPKHCLHLALKIKGADKVLGITDATRIACTDAKTGMLGSLTNGTEVIVDDGVAKLPDMTSFAGSICTMDRALRVLCADYDVDCVTAAKMLSTTPAAHIGMADTIGSIAPGKTADLVRVTPDFTVKTVIKNGHVC